jgi:hypothetical protein
MAVKVIQRAAEAAKKKTLADFCEGPDVEIRLFLKQTAHQKEQKKSTLTMESIAGRG